MGLKRLWQINDTRISERELPIKFEIRISKSEANPNKLNSKCLKRASRFQFSAIRTSSFGFVSDFGFRTSVFALAWLTFAAGAFAVDNIGILGSKPKWDVLEHYQHTVTHDEFAHLINDVYCTHGIPSNLISIDEHGAEIVTKHESSPDTNDVAEGQKVFTLQFAPDIQSEAKVPRLWRPAKSMPAAKPNKPLAGVRIALDPGHLGGKWAKMEERWFQVGNSKPVTEGDLTLRVSRMLATRLRKLGATVLFVRNSTQPTTPEATGRFSRARKKYFDQERRAPSAG